jgi:hypothetical protein
VRISEDIIANCLSNIRNLVVHRHLARLKKISHKRLLSLVKTADDSRTYKDLRDIVDSFINAKLIFPIGDQEIQVEYRSTYLNSFIYDRTNEIYKILNSDGRDIPEKLETLAEIFEILSQKDRITIVDLLSTNQKGMDRKNLERMVDTKGSLNHNLLKLSEAEIIKKDGTTILPGENMEKIIVSLEILRSAIIDAGRSINSIKPTVEDVMLNRSKLDHQMHILSQNATLEDALNYAGHSNSRYLLVKAHYSRPFVVDRFDLERARITGSSLSDPVNRAMSAVRPFWLSPNTPLSDPQIQEMVNRRIIGTVIDSTGACTGIVRVEEILSFQGTHNIMSGQKVSKKIHKGISFDEHCNISADKAKLLSGKTLGEPQELSKKLEYEDNLNRNKLLPRTKDYTPNTIRYARKRSNSKLSRRDRNLDSGSFSLGRRSRPITRLRRKRKNTFRKMTRA